MTHDIAKEIEKDCWGEETPAAGLSELHDLLCDYCPKGAKVPAAHIFETSAGKETATCEQHANIAMTCMKHLRRLGA
jgi:hypothetical protein